MKKLGPGHTLAACFTGYITQAIVVNFAPLLFVTFNTTYNISLTLIGLMITVNFGVQLTVDLLAAKFVDRIGYRPCAVAAHVFCCAGLVLLAVLPDVLPSPAVGLFIASAVYAAGGGLIEVLISPIVEACPYQKKKSVMSLLHSFYSWGQVAVVALSTLFFVCAGIGNWVILALVWAAVPLANAVFFLFVPIYPLVEEGQAAEKPASLLRSGLFWFFIVLMICAGGCEQAVSQWASAFAEEGLGVSKTVGDLLGPCLFAGMMGVSRVLFAKFGERIRLRLALLIAAGGCIAGYVLCAFSPFAWLGLAGCGIVGLSVGILWPGTISFASSRMPRGGTALFALLALGGDVGCMAAPSAVGALADVFGGDIRIGIAFGLLLPVLMFAVLLISLLRRNRQKARLPLCGRSGAAVPPSAGFVQTAAEGARGTLPAAEQTGGETSEAAEKQEGGTPFSDG